MLIFITDLSSDSKSRHRKVRRAVEKYRHSGSGSGVRASGMYSFAAFNFNGAGHRLWPTVARSQ